MSMVIIGTIKVPTSSEDCENQMKLVDNRFLFFGLHRYMITMATKILQISSNIVRLAILYVTCICA